MRKDIAIAACACFWAAAVTCIALRQPAAAPVQDAQENLADTVTVSGKAEIRTVPDKASISAGIELSEKTPEAANESLRRKADAVASALREAGIAEEDISTAYYSVDRKYRWDGDERIEDGYSAEALISVTGIDIDAAGEIIDAAVRAGATDIGRISYYSSGYREKYDEALAAAIREAREKADKMGEAAGFSVRGVCDMREGYQNDSARYVSNSISADGISGVTPAGSGISAGTVSVEAQVTVTYAIE